MSARLILLCALLAVAGCGQEDDPWKAAAKANTCNAKQYEVVMVQAEWCNKNAGYGSTFCYGTAIQRNCPPPPAASLSKGQP